MRDRVVIEWIDDDMAAVWCRKTVPEKMSVVDSMFRSARRMIAASVREVHPDWDDSRVESEVSLRIAHGTL